MKKIFTFIIFILLSTIYSSCVDKYDNYTPKKIGVVIDANVIETSFNESIKIQIKTEKQFFVVRSNINSGMPKINLGEPIIGLFLGDDLMYIVDSSGDKFNVL